jgi:ATP-binding cassette subfamily C (CFTR/MRP) protein 4
MTFIVCRIVRPKIVRNFISYFTNNHSNFNKTEACFLGVAFVVVEFTDLLYRDNFVLKLESLGVQMRTGLSSLIYRKMLKMNLTQLDNVSVGKIITLITRDVNEFDIFLYYTTLLWCESLRFVITCYVVYVEIGPLVAMLVGLFCLIILIQGK